MESNEDYLAELFGSAKEQEFIPPSKIPGFIKPEDNPLHLMLLKSKYAKKGSHYDKQVLPRGYFACTDDNECIACKVKMRRSEYLYFPVYDHDSDEINYLRSPTKVTSNSLVSKLRPYLESTDDIGRSFYISRSNHDYQVSPSELVVTTLDPQKIKKFYDDVASKRFDPKLHLFGEVTALDLQRSEDYRKRCRQYGIALGSIQSKITKPNGDEIDCDPHFSFNDDMI